VGLTLHVQDGESFRLRLGQALSVAVDGDLIRTRSTSKATDKSVRPTQIKVKGSGQECPLHTIHGTIRFPGQSELGGLFVLSVEVNKEET
jgi:hypothetical protein